jgi:phosphoglycerate dehydrogenase-like enzyme
LSDKLNFAPNCDVIVNLLPETQDTKGVCGHAFFEAMKSSAVFINAGRGSVLENDEAIIDALRSNAIHAAVLDVFADEPLNSEHPFYQLENCYITNHTAAVSNPQKVFSVFAQNLRRFIVSEPLQYQHNFLKGY